MSELWDQIQPYVQNRYLQALLAVVASLLLAWIVRAVVLGLIRALTRRTQTTLDDRLLEILRRPLFVTVVLAGLFVAVGRLGLDPEGIGLTTRRIVVTLGIFMWTGAGFRICHVVLEGLSVVADKVQWIEARTLPLLDNIAKVLVAGLAVYLFLLTWKLDVAPWLASAGIVGIALGFAAKDTLANLFGGVFILADAPFKIGDYVVLGSGERGEVTRIGLRSSRLLTRDDVEITIPNAVIANTMVINESGGPHEKYRVTVHVGVAYGSDADEVERVLLEASREVKTITGDPAPRVRFTAFGDSSLDFRLLCWVDQPVLRGKALHELNGAVYKALDRAGIEIPFPQRVVHLPGRAEGTEGETS
jgi:small-conductance mechanosensitive channel